MLCSLKMSSQRSNKTSWKCTTETSWRGSIDMSLGVWFETYLRCCWHVQRDVVTTSLWHLVVGWVWASKYRYYLFIIRLCLLHIYWHLSQIANLYLGHKMEVQNRQIIFISIFLKLCYVFPHKKTYYFFEVIHKVQLFFFHCNCQ